MNNKRSGFRGFGVYLILVLAVIAIWYWLDGNNVTNTYTRQQFETALAEGSVTQVNIVPNREVPTGSVNITFSDSSTQVMLVSDVAEIEQYMRDAGFKTYTVQNPPEESWLLTLLPYLIIFAAMFIFFMIMTNQAAANSGGGSKMMNFGKSRARRMSDDPAKRVKFSDVAGLQEEKEELEEIVDFLRAPKKYTQLGARIPKGVLLVGPPGTGKTLLAKAIAGEAGVPFFSISGSDFVEMFVGVGASRVRDLFEEAKKNAPCIIFIDEIDAVARRRGTGMGGGHDEREQTLNQLLTEMDGFDGSKGVVILAATNRPDSLDPALTRPGRFDRRIPVELPDLQGREDILKVHARKIKIADNVNFHEIAKAASGASGAELANIVNEAALRAVRDGRRFATQADLEESIEVVIAGYQKKSRVLSEKEKLIVSYHEVGHALVAALQTNSAPVHKITIIPRTSGALGYTMQVEEGERFLMSKEEMANKIATLTGGRAAEEIIFHSITTGASNDIEQATKLARGMITRYGMSKRFGLVGLATVESQYLEGRTALNCSDETAAAIDEEVVAMIKESYDQALQMLRENRELMDKLAAFLIERETITGKEFMEIFRREKGLPDPEEEKKDVTETNAAGSAVKGNSVDVTIGEQVMTSTDSTFQPLTFEDSLQEAKEQTAPAQDTAKQPAESAKEETSAQEKHEQESTEQKSDAAEESKDPKDPPQGPVGLFSHGTL